MAFTGTISHEGRVAPPKDILEAAVHCADQLRAQKNALDAPRLMKSYELTGGYQVYVLDMENVWRVHIIPPIVTPEDDWPVPEPEIKLEFDPLITIAGVVSGAAQVITLDQHDLDLQNGRPWAGLYVKDDKVDLMPETAKLFSRPEAAYKVGVIENPAMAPIRPPTELIYSQFATIEPGNYTGAMSSVVQLLLGVGKLVTPDYEERWLLADVENLPLILDLEEETPEGEEPEVPPSFYNDKYGEEEEEIQITYDWRWNRTHGVMWAESQPMLVELGQRGVYVMPFPVDEHSQRPEVQAHYLEVYPDLARFTPFKDGTQTLFEAFGGFPTGERMPGVKADLEREVRAGRIYQADKDLAEFYTGFGMSTGFGWAFAGSAPMAINTCVTYNELGQKVGRCYEVRLRMAERSDETKVRNTVAGGVIAALELTEEIDLFKAERLSQEFAEEMLDSPNYDQFDAYEVTPDWTIIAEIAKVREGIIEYPGYQCTRGASPCGMIGAPHFKYFEPAIGSVLNFDFEIGEDVPVPKRSDGPIFATYVDNTPEILNYFWEPNPAVSVVTNTRQPCQYEGSWEVSNYSEGAGVVGYFYTSSRDFRDYKEVGGGSRSIRTAERHGDYDFMSYCAFFARHSVITKIFVGSESWEGQRWNSKSYMVSVSCAANNRSMFFVCAESMRGEVEDFAGFGGFKNIGTSGAYRLGSIYNFIFHWTGVCRREDHPGTGTPACVMVNSDPLIGDPFSCHGVEPPDEVLYSVCCVNGGNIGGCFANSDLVVISPADNAVIQSAAVTRAPTGPPAWSSPPPPLYYEYEYEIWAFGHPLMHNRRIKREEEIVTEYQSIPPSLSDTTWWRCSIPGECPAYPWRVVANYYGPPYVGTNEEFGFGWVEYGLKPQVGGRFFGVVY